MERKDNSCFMIVTMKFHHLFMATGMATASLTTQLMMMYLCQTFPEEPLQAVCSPPFHSILQKLTSKWDFTPIFAHLNNFAVLPSDGEDNSFPSDVASQFPIIF